MAAQRLTEQVLDRLVAAQPSPAEADMALVNAEASFLRQLTVVRRGLLKLLADRRYAPGEIVFQEGEKGDSMCLIRSGRVAIVKGDLQSPTILGYRGPGEIVGEMALLEEKARSATVVALEETQLLRIKRSDFDRFLQNEPDVGMRLMEMLSSRLRATDDMLTAEAVSGRALAQQVSDLQQERLQWVELQRLLQESLRTIAQDLRGPLSTILTSLQMLQLVLPEDMVAGNEQLFSVATSAGESMQRLLESLLDAARLEAGEVQLQRQEAQLRYIVDRAVDTTALSLRTAQILLHPVLPDDLPPVLVDAQIIERVLVNLIDNAVQHTPPKGQVIVAAELGDGQVLLSVKDSAVPIPAEEYERLFEQIAEPCSSRSRRGLPFCHLAVRAHGGQIWVEAAEDGNRFVVSLPLGK
ncbi:MAG: cyclic nucleotide-binding domain-containing protein [Chloroflexia bacterium]|nr:cyclic nucleotide-binding domain-containing protein [Chloroflexia bacterium]